MPGNSQTWAFRLARLRWSGGLRHISPEATPRSVPAQPRSQLINLLQRRAGTGWPECSSLVFLLRAGVSVPATLCAMAGGRRTVRDRLAVLPRRSAGLKPLLIFGNAVIALRYPVLAEVPGRSVPGRVLSHPGTGDTFYWTTYPLLRSSEQRASRPSDQPASPSTVVGIVAPLIGAWALVGFGPRLAFGAAGLIRRSRRCRCSRSRTFRFRARRAVLCARRPGVRSPSPTAGSRSATSSSGDRAVSRAGRVSMAAHGPGCIRGRSERPLPRPTHRRGSWPPRVAIFCGGGVTLLLRARSLETPWVAVGANALGALAMCLLAPAQMTPVYNLAKASPCALRFHIAAEGGWDIGHLSGCLVAAFLIAGGASLSAVIPLGFLGLAGQILLVRRYYRRLEAW